MRILVGVALLVAGRRLFWLFVGLIGLVSGMRLASHFFPGQPEWMILAIALVAGVFKIRFFESLAMNSAFRNVQEVIVGRSNLPLSQLNSVESSGKIFSYRGGGAFNLEVHVLQGASFSGMAEFRIPMVFFDRL